MEINQEMGAAQRFSMLMCQRVVNSDISEDFTLPDYCPEIRRVLYIKEDIPVPARFISGNKIDVNGVVDYTLVYVNHEGNVCSAPISAEYSFSLPIDNANEFELGDGVTVIAHTVAENSSVRVSSPRRLQIRSHLRSNVCAYGKVLCEDNFKGLEDETSVQRLESESVYADILCESSDVITLDDEYIFPGSGCSVALADSGVWIENSRIDGESVLVAGEAVIRMLVMCDGTSEGIIRKIPFEAEIDLSGIDISTEVSVRINGFVTDTSLNIEDGRVAIEINLILEACVGQNKPLRYTKDVYSTKQECDKIMKQYALPVVLSNKNFSFSQSEKVSASDLNFPEGADIIHVYGSAVADDFTVEDGKQVLRGNCKYNMICLVGGEYTHVEAKLPFNYETDCEEQVEVFDSVLRLSNCKARCDGEFISLESDVLASCSIVGSKLTEMPGEVSFTEARDEQKDRWIVYYVSGDDDLWSIAKRYGVCECSIKGDPSSDRYVMIEK